ncbi:MAG: hypothetical protein EA388_11535 [Nitriliruptor sp.]|nr:MAG: hypothetical protein EA388_11535 [Nitriliruptor sp.]
MESNESQLPPANDHYERTSLVFESILAGHLVHWQPRWSPNVRLVTDPGSPWFPITFGWLGPSTSTRVTHATSQLTADKVRTQELLDAAGVPTPRSEVFPPDGYADARRFATEIGWPVVVKPVGGGQGRGVSAGIGSDAGLDRAFSHINEAGYGTEPFLVQQHVSGRCYRVLASRERVYGAYYKLPAHVVGDGISTVEKLVLFKNSQRQANPHLGTSDRAIVLDGEARRLLSRQGIGAASVPSLGELVQLAIADNTHRGADSIEVTGETNPDVASVVTRAIQAIPGLDYGGVDIILPRGHREAASVDSCSVIEVNCGTGLGGHLYPMYGPPNNVCHEIVTDTATSAGLVPRRFDNTSVVAVAVRLMHDSRPSDAATALPDLAPVATPTVIPRDGDTLAVLVGDSANIYAAIHNHLARTFGTIIAVRVKPKSTGHDGPTLEQRLPPAPFLPLRHAEALAAANR